MPAGNSESLFTKKMMLFLYAGISLSAACIFVPGYAFARTPSLETQHVRPVEKWVVEPVSDDGDDKYDFCMARTYYNNGLIFIMARDKFGQQRIAVNFPDNRLNVGETHPVKLATDKDPATEYTSVSAGKNMLVVSFGKDEDFLKKIGGGYSLTMSSANDAVEFDLYGIGAALEKLSDCAEDKLEKPEESAQETPGVDSSAPAYIPEPIKDIPALQKNDEVKPEKQEIQYKPALPPVIVSALSTANHPAENISAPSSVSPKIPLDYVWSYPETFAGYKNIPAAAGFNTAVKTYINTMRPLCNGPFIAEASPVYKINGAQFMHAEIGCSSSKRDSIASLIFFESAGNSVEVLYFEASSDKGADVISLRNNVSKNIESSLRKR